MMLFRANPIVQTATPEHQRLTVVTLEFLATLTSHCQAAKRLLVVGSGNESLINVLSDVIRSGSGITGNGVYQKFRREWIAPTAYRIVISALTSQEVRSNLIKRGGSGGSLLNEAVESILSESEQAGAKKAKSQVLKTTMHLDLLLSLTAFADGQTWAGKSAQLINCLAGIASTVSSQQSNNGTSVYPVHQLAALAVLHNLSFIAGRFTGIFIFLLFNKAGLFYPELTLTHIEDQMCQGGGRQAAAPPPLNLEPET